jgi:hypothetical protein
MAKEKVTITLDRSKANRARALLAARSTSEVIDLALDRLIDAEQLRRDPEAAIAFLADTRALADDTDWEALYPDSEND